MRGKHAIVIAAGAADEPCEELDGHTPLEAASTPALDEAAARGRQGTVRTIPRGFTASRDVATLGLLGYDVRDSYAGYAGIEALGRRVYLKPEELAFRANLVTVEAGVVVDSTAGGIPTEEARGLIGALNSQLGSAEVRFEAGLSYRHLLVVRRDWADVSTTPAHDVIGQRMAGNWPGGRGAAELRALMQQACEALNGHAVNVERARRGLLPANGLWLWGQGVLPRVRRFRDRFGLRGAAVGAVDLFRGIALLLGWSLEEVRGATGGLDTDYGEKGRRAMSALEEADLVVVHVEAADEASHAGQLAGKMRAVEKIDGQIVGPLLERLRRMDRWSLLFAPDLAAHVRTRVHGSEPVPFCVAGSSVTGASEPRAFGESAARGSDLHVTRAWELMEYFLRT